MLPAKVYRQRPGKPAPPIHFPTVSDACCSSVRLGYSSSSRRTNSQYTRILLGLRIVVSWI